MKLLANLILLAGGVLALLLLTIGFVCAVKVLLGPERVSHLSTFMKLVITFASLALSVFTFHMGTRCRY